MLDLIIYNTEQTDDSVLLLFQACGKLANLETLNLNIARFPNKKLSDRRNDRKLGRFDLLDAEAEKPGLATFRKRLRR